MDVQTAQGTIKSMAINNGRVSFKVAGNDGDKSYSGFTESYQNEPKLQDFKIGDDVEIAFTTTVKDNITYRNVKDMKKLNGPLKVEEQKVDGKTEAEYFHDMAQAKSIPSKLPYTEWTKRDDIFRSVALQQAVALVAELPLEGGMDVPNIVTKMADEFHKWLTK